MRRAKPDATNPAQVIRLRSSPAWEEDVEPSIRAWLQD
jgi:hypothetical protein